MKRIVAIEQPARLSFRHRQLVIEGREDSPLQVPLEDLGVLVIDHAAVIHTQPLLVACTEANVVVVFCDGKHQPCAILTPLSGSTLHTRTLALQAALSKPARGRLWRMMIQSKITAQARVLKMVTGSDEPLKSYAGRVRNGDPDNVEAQAARLYWKRLFGPQFRRDPNADGINGFLNYGYAILRAAVARSIVGAGLHPSLGFHHHNQYDSLCLADDMMEPLRPHVDRKVYMLSLDHEGASLVLDSASKRVMLELLTTVGKVGAQQLPLIECLHRYAASVRRVISLEAKIVEFPKI